MANQCNRPRGVLPIMAHTGSPPLPPEMGTFLRLYVYQGIEVYDRVGKSVIPVGKKSSKGLTHAFYG